MIALLRTARARMRAVRAPLAALFAILAIASVEARAQDRSGSAPGGGDEVVARVDGAPIHASDVEEALRDLPPQYASMPPETLYNAILEQLIDRQLVVGQARKLELQNDVEVQRTMRRLEARVLEQFFYRRAIDRKVTEEAVRRRYERDRDQLVADKKVHARHILVKTREEAEQIIAELQKGADFASLAREKSIGPSKTQGGDLGFFAREQMVPAFSAMAFSLSKGAVSRAPVQTEYGWHVIKVEDIQEAAPPKFDDVKDELRAKIADEVIEAEIKDLREAASIERLGAEAGTETDGGRMPEIPVAPPAAQDQP